MAAHVCYSCQREVFSDEILSNGRHDVCGARVKSLEPGQTPTFFQTYGVRLGVVFLIGLSVGVAVGYSL